MKSSKSVKLFSIQCAGVAKVAETIGLLLIAVILFSAALAHRPLEIKVVVPSLAGAVIAYGFAIWLRRD